ncbi:MAG TPA: CHRD domain-containing protein, partial [Pyrinomonadaceae bacterium]|nr:CHRD domain-containing protein [Pyrinomonadaceae bacterium]
MRRKMFLMMTIALSVFVFSMIALAQQKFSVSLNGQQEVPARTTNGRGTCMVTLNVAQTEITVNCTYSGLSSAVVGAHIHDAGPVGVNGPIRFNFNYTGGTSGTIGPLTFPMTPALVAELRAKRMYVNIHTSNFTGGEIRGQVKIASTVFDLEGDGRTNISVFRFSNATFYTLDDITNNVIANRLGSGTDADIWLNNTGDFDGDGRGDPLVLSLPGSSATNAPLFWSILQSGSNTIRTVQWGNFATANGETLTPADYNGDGMQDLAVYRRSTGIWYILESPNFTPRYEYFGPATTAAGNNFVSVGDYDKDGKADLTVIVNEGGQRVWYIRQSSNGQVRVVPFGSTSDSFFFFAPIDVDGDGAQDILVRRDSNGTTAGGSFIYYALRSSDNQVFALQWGLDTDTPFFGDYDGDGKTDFASRRTVSGQFVWYIYQSSTQTG